MYAWRDVERFGENVLLVDLLMVELHRLPGWFCERASDEEGWSRALAFIGDGDGRIGHGGKAIRIVRR